ncbi:hypothetical protein ACJMK2_034059 [Sinanodonta woodiana]|uniref:Glycosyltransferase 2-like domain-containing protein n=1 Tax=Sinanodonta woodiana TaxID=1069815 RepID=A0ABD3WTW2_SINWO
MSDVSIILAVHNAERWLDDCLASVVEQTFSGKLELSVYLDACTDSSESIIQCWKDKLAEKDITVIISGHQGSCPRGAGFSKNRAVMQSSGKYLCILDADDVMCNNRVAQQFAAAKSQPDSIIGCKFHRMPEGSTERYTKWANTLSPDQLYTQVYTSHGPTLIMPTWFFERQVFDKVGGLDEGGKGVPEDLIFFYKHLEQCGKLYRVEQDLLMYRHHPESATFSITEETIWRLRVDFIQRRVLDKWETFTIWNAGKQGRKLFRYLTPQNQRKVSAFCDVDAKKIAKKFYIYEESKERPKPKIPVIDFREAEPPFIICIKLDLTSGSFEKNIESLKLLEGIDYFHFN